MTGSDRRHDPRAEARILAAQLAHYLEAFAEGGVSPYVPWVGGPTTTSDDVQQSGSANNLSFREPISEARRAPDRVQAASSSNDSRSPERAEPKVTPDQPPARNASERVRRDAAGWSSAKKLDYLRLNVIGDCRRCALSQRRQNIVFGAGNPDASVMFVGEAPGADEDRLGEPFVGAAGKRLTAWLGQIGLSRDDVYIANVLKCRPPRNRDPEPEEIAQCSGFLRAQIRAISPQVLVALGRFAGTLLLDRPGMKMYQMRGSQHAYTDPKLEGREIPVIVTYHPSYVLRREKDARPGGAQSSASSKEEGEVLGDLYRAQALMRRAAPE